MPKIVLDTNVLLSGLITTSGNAARIIDAARNGDLQIVLSPILAQELSEVIVRPHIVQKYPLVSQQAEILLDYLRANAIWVKGLPKQRIVAADADDDFVIACAIDGEAEYIVSGDTDLLSIGRYENIIIMSPRQFVDLLPGQ